MSAEIAMLRKHGHEVIFYERHNGEYDRLSLWGKLRFIARDIFWSPRTFGDITRLVREHKPDAVHVHNILFFVSPSVYDACRAQGVPVVQTIHNYRLLCANGLFYRNGRPCEDCFKTAGLSAVRHRCLRSSFLFSSLYFCLLKWMRFKGVLRRKVDLFIAPGEFARGQFIGSGSVEASRVAVKGHFVEDPASAAAVPEVGRYALFAGAVADYKGIRTLLRAWQGMTDIPLKIVGNGPLLKELKAQYPQGHIEWMGAQSWERTMAHVRHSAFVVAPSECYETFSRIIVDAYACGVPVIASRIGALTERIIPNETGLLFEPGDADDLKEKVLFLYRDPQLNKVMRKNARRLYNEQYREEANYQTLMGLYRQVSHGR